MPENSVKCIENWNLRCGNMGNPKSLDCGGQSSQEVTARKKIFDREAPATTRGAH